MKTIGLTGGIGSGKSTVAEVFRLLNAPVFNADQVAKTAYEDFSVKAAVVDLLGEDCYGDNGELNRKFIADQVFSSPELLQKLNEIIHPFVSLKFAEWEKKNESFVYGIKEAAIFFESGLNNKIKETIVVSAPEKIRIERVMKRDGLSEKSVRERMKNQWPEEELVKRSTYVLVNDNKSLLLPEILKLHDHFSS